MNLFNDSFLIKITSASTEETITKICQKGVVLNKIKLEDPFSFQCLVNCSDYSSICRMADKYMWDVKQLKRSGGHLLLVHIAKRPVFAVGVLILLVLALYLPTRVFFVFIEGNDIVSSNLIMDVAKSCGLGFGDSRVAVKNEKIKNQLLDEIPQLEWACVNTYGCVAVVTVRERSSGDPQVNQNRVSHIVSSQDGVISSVDVKSGEGLCAVGQAVKKGEKLVSGYIDCGIKIRAERSVAEIFAHTTRDLTVIAPKELQKKPPCNDQNTHFSIIIGKKLINLSQDSGIFDSVCDKMYKKYTLTLPGGFELPFSLLCAFTCDEANDVYPLVLDNDLVTKNAIDYLNARMVAGTIENRKITFQEEKDFIVLDGTFYCKEMIGKELYEEHFDQYE